MQEFSVYCLQSCKVLAKLVSHLQYTPPPQMMTQYGSESISKTINN